MGRDDPRHLVVGHLDRAHGIRGELVVSPLTDHPESVYAPGVVLLLGEADADEPSADLPPLRVQAARPFQRGLLVRFGGVDDRNQAELLRGRYLFRAVDELEPLGEGEVYYHQLIGMEVVTVQGADLGRVTEVYELQPADMLEVSGAQGRAMIPFLDHVVVQVDTERGRVVVDPPDGLLDL